MPLISYISVPYTTSTGAVEYVRMKLDQTALTSERAECSCQPHKGHAAL